MQDLFFCSQDHKERLLASLESIGKIYDGTPDPEYVAALYILTADPYTWNEVSRYVSRDGISIKGIQKSFPMSSGEAALVKLAGNLFNGRERVSPLDFIGLDETNFTIAMRDYL